MAHHWISLPSKFKLEDVQAVLNVVVTAFSALATFAFVRCCWQRAAKRVAKTEDVPVHLLLSINTLGEVLDLVLLLKQNLLDSCYLILSLQCLVIICLTTTTILSGPIVRYATKIGTIVREQDVGAMLASRIHNGMGYANVEWNITYDRLEKAGFPKDQLLDCLPDNSVDWNFKSDQWNNSWTLACEQTPFTSIELRASGNCTGLMQELPGLEQAFSYTQWDSYWQSWDGFYNNRTTNKDILLFVHAVKDWDYAEAENTYLASSIMVMVAYMHSVPQPDSNASSDCEFGIGNIGKASYNKIECKVTRRSEVQDFNNVAFPDVKTPGSLALAYTEYYQARFTQESTSDSVISAISPEELIRFYQVYMINKDIQYRQPVTRRLSAAVKVVQISVGFLVTAVLVAVAIVMQLLVYAIFALRFRRIIPLVPQSKLDWMIQSIKEVENRTSYPTNREDHRGIVVQLARQLGATDGASKERNRIENAKFGSRRSIASMPGSPPPPFRSYANSTYTEKPKHTSFCDCSPGQTSRYVKSDLQPHSTVTEVTENDAFRLQK